MLLSNTAASRRRLVSGSEASLQPDGFEHPPPDNVPLPARRFSALFHFVSEAKLKAQVAGCALRARPSIAGAAEKGIVLYIWPGPASGRAGLETLVSAIR